MAAVHARQGSGASSISLGYPAPGSPTLTNPDMILPDYDGPDLPDRSESPLSLWQNNHQASGAYQSHQNFYMAGPITPTTPIIYGNGTMLSDIGEVTEVESTVGRSPIVSRRIDVARTDNQATPKSSPTLGGSGPKKRPRPQQDRRASVGSNSTVTSAHEQAGHFADFDDAVSVDDSVFQGDDEESIAESTIEERQAKFLPRPQGTGLNNDNRNSTVSLSQKAEEILANAKKRLTVSMRTKNGHSQDPSQLTCFLRLWKVTSAEPAAPSTAPPRPTRPSGRTRPRPHCRNKNPRPHLPAPPPATRGCGATSLAATTAPFRNRKQRGPPARWALPVATVSRCRDLKAWAIWRGLTPVASSRTIPWIPAWNP